MHNVKLKLRTKDTVPAESLQLPRSLARDAVDDRVAAILKLCSELTGFEALK